MLPWILLSSALMFGGSIFLAGTLIVRMPADYLTRNRPPANRFRDRHPFIRGLAWLVKNAIGLAMIVSGLIMLVTPGQGVLFIVLGLMLLDFPGKRRFLCRLLGRRSVLRMINRVRRRAKKPPLENPTPCH